MASNVSTDDTELLIGDGSKATISGGGPGASTASDGGPIKFDANVERNSLLLPTDPINVEDLDLETVAGRIQAEILLTERFLTIVSALHAQQLTSSLRNHAEGIGTGNVSEDSNEILYDLGQLEDYCEEYIGELQPLIPCLLSKSLDNFSPESRSSLMDNIKLLKEDILFNFFLLCKTKSSFLCYQNNIFECMPKPNTPEKYLICLFATYVSHSINVLKSLLQKFRKIYKCFLTFCPDE